VINSRWQGPEPNSTGRDHDEVTGQLLGVLFDDRDDLVEVGSNGVHPQQDHSRRRGVMGDHKLPKIVVGREEHGTRLDGSLEDSGIIDPRSVLGNRAHLDALDAAQATDERCWDVLVSQQPENHATVS